MVTGSRSSRRGASSLGCIVSLVLVVACLYYGLNLGRLWFRYFEIKDRMNTVARFGSNQTVEQMTRQLQFDAQDVGLPKDARDFRISKSDRPPSVTVSLEYSEPVDLFLLHRSFVFRPVVTHSF
jgi:hypothetical protein